MIETAGSLGEAWTWRKAAQQRGAISVMFALMMLILLGFIGMSLDLGRVYNRAMELQAVANVAALAAARQLNGTPAGVSNALKQAAYAVGALKYQYHQQAVSWDNSALSFSATASGSWIDAAAAQAAPDGLLFARADTSKLAAPLGTIDLMFMRMLSPALASTSTSAKAVAGRSTINVAPLAVCAMGNAAAAKRSNPGPPPVDELVEYGYRRGVSYDLMQLNPNGSTPSNFIIDPFAPPGIIGAASNTAPAVAGPYVCTGQLAMPRISGAAISVSQPFPLASLFQQFNSRFDQYPGALCSYATAPPDSNIKSYLYSTAIPWMAAVPGGQGALSSSTGGALWTVADPLPAPAGNTAPMYGPLWSYARAVQYSPTQPAGGYVPLATGAWATLYKPGAPTAVGTYLAGGSTPYQAVNGATFQAPPAAHQGVANRRVLNVALLSCPVGAGRTTATVLGIGKFFMTVPATASSLDAEFAGLVQEQSLGGAVVLYP